MTLNNCLCGSVELTKNTNPGPYNHSGYDIVFDSSSQFSFIDGSVGENVVIFGADMSSSVHINNKNKNILIFGEGTTQVLLNTTLKTEAKYFINFTHNYEKDLH